VVPVVYPITGFELSYGLYALLISGLISHQALDDAIETKVEELEEHFLRNGGLSFGDNFVSDVDDTGVAITVLRARGRSPDPDLLFDFWHNDHFYTYSQELNPSVFSNAHALHALTVCGRRSKPTEKFLIQRQQPEGFWLADKWHTSWRFTTLEVVVALSLLGHGDLLTRSGQALLADQRPDGSWGDGQTGSTLETSYSILALRILAESGLLSPSNREQLVRGERWLRANVSAGPGRQAQEQERWLGKVAYTPRRVDRVYALSVLATFNESASIPCLSPSWC
jgi:hypothetical protein